MTSFLYIIAHPEGWRKIGYAANPIKRLSQHQRHSGERLKGEVVFSCDDPIEKERKAHRALISHRIMGEWFNIDLQSAVDAITKATGLKEEPFPQKPTKISPDKKHLNALSNIEQIDILQSAFKSEDSCEIDLALDAVAHSRGMTMVALYPGESVPADFVRRMLDGENPLRLWRDYRALTQQGLADASGVNRAMIAQIENGTNIGSVETLSRLAVALSVTIDDLAPSPSA